jgi:hypothetical protein
MLTALGRVGCSVLLPIALLSVSRKGAAQSRTTVDEIVGSGVALLDKGELERAQEAFAKALSLEPGNRSQLAGDNVREVGASI